MGKTVVLLEAGPFGSVDASSLDFDCSHEESHYSGATTGRYFGLGGSTTRWGGVLVPHTSHDLREADRFGEAWTAIVGAVSENAQAVLERLGYSRGPDFADFARKSLGAVRNRLNSAGFEVIAGLMMPFRRRNLAGLLEDDYSGSANLRVYVNAVVTSWRCGRGSSRNGRVVSVTARTRNGNEIVVEGSRFVIAAGAIESTRILLEMNEAAPQPMLRSASSVGFCLADHLSAPIAELSLADRSDAVKLFSPRFSGTWVRGFRFIETDPPANAPRAFAHFVFAGLGKGFDLVKELLGALQRRQRPHVALATLPGSAGELIRLAWTRATKSALYVPTDADVRLHVDVEQEPVRSNRVRLSSERDAYGRRRISIAWKVSDSDLARLSETARRIVARWPARKNGLPGITPIAVEASGVAPHDAYHPVGTCRMGVDSEAVVDPDLRVWGMDNLWVTSTAVLPSAGTANPTFTLLCLTHRLANHLGTSC